MWVTTTTFVPLSRRGCPDGGRIGRVLLRARQTRDGDGGQSISVRRGESRQPFFAAAVPFSLLSRLFSVGWSLVSCAGRSLAIPLGGFDVMRIDLHCHFGRAWMALTHSLSCVHSFIIPCRAKKGKRNSSGDGKVRPLSSLPYLSPVLRAVRPGSWERNRDGQKEGWDGIG